MVGDDLRNAKRAFQALKRTFIAVSGLPQPYFDEKNQLHCKLVFLKPKNAGRKPQTCIDVRFRP